MPNCAPLPYAFRFRIGIMTLPKSTPCHFLVSLFPKWEFIEIFKISSNYVHQSPLSEPYWGEKIQHIRMMVFPSNRSQVILRGDPHVPQNERATC